MAEKQNSSSTLPPTAAGSLNAADSLEEAQGRPESEEMKAESSAGGSPAVAMENGASVRPGDDGSPETCHLLNIFPTEVWLLILENVEEKETADFQRISNASAYFRTLLQPRSVEMMFPDVIKILIEKQCGLLSFPGDVLLLRKVCRAWQHGVDLALEDPDRLYLLDNEETVQMGSEHPTEYFKPFTFQGFRKFEEKFDSTHLIPKRNPFVFRGITLQIPARGGVDIYFHECFQLLGKYGTHVWHCIIGELQNLDRMETLKFYKTDIKFMLKRMRNLRTLEIHDTCDLQGRYLHKLAGSLSAAPLPFLPRLRKIAGCGHSIPAPFLRALVARNPDIEVVDGRFFDSSSAELVKLYLEEMPNLKRLSLVLNTEAEFQAFCSAQAICPLEVLELRMVMESMDPKMLCRALETHFSRSLTQLWIEIPRSMEHQFDSDDWNLPNIKQLTTIPYQ